MPTAFVTGGSGFVGRHLLSRLRASGYTVRALSRSEAASRLIREAGGEPVPCALTDADALATAMAGCDVVFHLAAKLEEWGPPEDFLEVNVRGTEAVLAAARRAGVRRLVHASSEAVLYGRGRTVRRADETQPRAPRPVGLYPRTKALAEERVLAANGPGLETVVVRPRLVWGRGDTALLPRVADAVRAGRFAWIDGGRHLTSTCHVRNACEGLQLAAERGRAGEVYFVTDGEPVELRAFLTALLRAQGVDPGERSLPGWLARALAITCDTAWTALRLRSPPPITELLVHLLGQEVTVVDAKARRELGYRGEVSREEGLREL